MEHMEIEHSRRYKVVAESSVMRQRDASMNC